MTYVDRYANFDLATGANDGTSEADAWQSWADIYAGLTAGVRVNIKKQSAPLDFSTFDIDYQISGITSPPTASHPIMFSGYESVTGDGGMWEAECDQGGLRNFRIRDCEFCHFENLKVHAGPTNNNLVLWLGTHSNGFITVRNCSTISTSFITYGHVANSYIGLRGTLTVGRAVFGSTSNRTTHVIDSVVDFISSGTNTFSHDHLISVDDFLKSCSFTNCIFLSRTSTTQDGINHNRPQDSESITYDQCRFYGFDNAIVFAVEPAFDDRKITITNCVFEDCGRAIYRGGASELGFVKIRDCYYRNMTTEFTNYTEISETHNTPLTADAFVDGVNGNFLLNSTAGGGQVIRDAGGSYDNGGTFETPSEFFGTMFEEGGGSVTPSTHTYFG